LTFSKIPSAYVIGDTETEASSQIKTQEIASAGDAVDGMVQSPPQFCYRRISMRFYHPYINGKQLKDHVTPCSIASIIIK